MRISVDATDPGYAEWVHRRAPFGRVRVWCDGVDMGQVITADEERGLIIRTKCDSDGTIMVDRDAERVATETVFGEVRIEFLDEESAL